MDGHVPKASELTLVSIVHAAEIITNAKALLITAGAGMGVDSGLPDFRGPEGFWRAYPAYRKLGLNFAALAGQPQYSDVGDSQWDATRSIAQERRLMDWLWLQRTRKLSLVIVELGAGTAIPTVRYFSEKAVRKFGGQLIRINVRDPAVLDGHVGLPIGAVEALQKIDAQMPIFDRNPNGIN